MAYEEYDPISFPCEALDCGGQVWVTKQGTLHWYHQSGGGERPKGYARCEDCQNAILTATVACLNKATGIVGDSGCIGSGRICIHDVSESAAVWFVMNGQRERPRMYPYCNTCKYGVVYVAPCRNRGCRGSGSIGATGDDKQGLLFLTEKTGEPFWPPRNCRPCREFMDSLRDSALTCGCCKRSWLWSRGRQIMLVRNEPRDAYRPPELCDACLALSDDERNAIRRRSVSDIKRREARRAVREAVKTARGRELLRQSSRSRFLDVVRTMYRAPDRDAVDAHVKAAAVTRLTALGGDAALGEMHTVLEAANVDAGRVSAMLANHAITDGQARQLSRALAKLAAGGKFPKGLADRMKTTGGLGMTTALAGTRSSDPKIAQAAAYELHAAASIANNRSFPYPFDKSEIARFHYRFQHNRYGSTSHRGSYEGDLVVNHQGIFGKTTFVDFKHSTVDKPYVTSDNLERMYHGLTRGEIHHAVIVSNAPLTQASENAIQNVNARIDAVNREFGDDISHVRTFVQKW